jgi:hypothetical protein
MEKLRKDAFREKESLKNNTINDVCILTLEVKEWNFKNYEHGEGNNRSVQKIWRENTRL